MFVYHVCACLVPVEARRESIGSSGLELQTTVSCHVGTGNQTWVLRKSS